MRRRMRKERKLSQLAKMDPIETYSSSCTVKVPFKAKETTELNKETKQTENKAMEILLELDV